MTLRTILAWCAVSVPVGVLVGRWLRAVSPVVER